MKLISLNVCKTKQNFKIKKHEENKNMRYYDKILSNHIDNIT